MGYLPVMMNLQRLPVLIVGGGAVAARKAKKFIAQGARLTIISPTLHPTLYPTLTDASLSGSLHWIPRSYHAGDLQDMRLVITATNCAEVNHAVMSDAQALNILVSDASHEDESDFMMMADHWHSNHLVTAVSTTGIWPAAAREVLHHHSQYLSPWWNDVIAVMDSLLAELEAVPDPARRASLRRALRSSSPSKWLDQIDKQGPEGLRSSMHQWLSRLAGVEGGQGVWGEE
ncbi:MAG: hypothetical protein C7B44_07065 [Sulfobacillus thermosulfidooxidans]|nr:MAG: hypothetical protein C7B44_07065 [Sulfobacillus thermosulfidooxidans]